ncbi:1867_t:CDS:2, partial [Gigaspora rosea]
SQIEGEWTEEWVEQTKGWIKTLERKLKEKEKRRIEKNIVENIERRYNMIRKSDKMILNNILERPWRKIIIDKVVREENIPNTHGSLITEPEQKSEYAPKEWISEKWYKELMSPIQE